MQQTLNDNRIRALQPQDKPYRVKDAGGLFLDVRPTGAKFWRITDRQGDKVQTKTLSQYPTVSLTAARAELSNLRLLIERGGNPKEDAVDTSMTFGQLALEWWNAKRSGWKTRYAEAV